MRSRLEQPPHNTSSCGEGYRVTVLEQVLVDLATLERLARNVLLDYLFGG